MNGNNLIIFSKKMIISLLIIFILCLGIALLIGQYKWSSRLVNAVIDRDKDRVEMLLKDRTKNLNFKGRCFEGHTKPLTRTCLDTSYDALKILEMLLNAGAKVEQVDYYCELDGINKFSFRKIKLMLNTGVKPKLSSNIKYCNLLETIAHTDTSYLYDIYDMSQEEWKKMILEIYKLVYSNAQPFNKEKELKSSLKLAKEAQNKLLVRFIKSEISKLE